MIRTNRGRGSVRGTAEEEAGRKKKNKDSRSSLRANIVSLSRRGVVYAAIKEDDESGLVQQQKKKMTE